MLAEWGLTPEYIVSNWTREKLDLMVEKLNDRKTRATQVSGDSSGNRDCSTDMASRTQFLQKARNMIKVVKADGS